MFSTIMLLAGIASRVAAEGLMGAAAGAVEAATTQPNIIFIFTDDQDSRLNSLQYMESVQQNLVERGATFLHHYCTVALCCPSRVNLWTGRAAHNTNVTDLHPPYGGYSKFISEGWNHDWLPVWMQKGGYNTYYVGKLMNSYTEENYLHPEAVNGFNGSDFLIGAGTYDYYSPTYQRNVGGKHEKPKKYHQQYTTGLTFTKGMDFLDDARKAGGPFFLTMAPVACHDGFGVSPQSPDQSPPGPVPEVKYATMFPNVNVPRTANFNPENPSGSAWLLDIARLNQTEINFNDEWYRNRLRTLKSVDDLVQGTFDYLDRYGLTNNTYVIYSADNGFHISQHRLQPGKRCPYEEDLNVPLIISGPGIKANIKINVATSHTDIAPTILQMAGITPPDGLDGTAIPPLVEQPDTQNFETVQVEYWGNVGGGEDHQYPHVHAVKNNTYKSLRIIGSDYSYHYTVWCTNQHELYDMNTDVDQMNNLYQPYSYIPNAPPVYGNAFPIPRLESRLDALLLVLKDCKGSACSKPWSQLHPDGGVQNLKDAMNTKFDLFYMQKQHRVSFEECTQTYLPEFEGPTTYIQYKANMARRGINIDRML